MKQTVNLDDFVKAFQNIRPNNFSYSGATALFHYLERLEQDCDNESELDVIAFCSEYTEYQNIEDYNNDNNEDVKSIEEIERKTAVIRINYNSFIIVNY